MADVYDANGNLLGNFILSEKEQQFLATGAPITRIFHTPQLARELGDISGKFTLVIGEGGRITASDPAQVQLFIQLRAAIDAREATLVVQRSQSEEAAASQLATTRPVVGIK